MPHRRYYAHALGTDSSSRFEQPGEAYEDDTADPGDYLTIAGIGSDDPAFAFIARAFASLAIHGFDTDDPDLVARAVEVGRKRYAEHIAAPKPEAPPTPAGYFPQPPPGFKRWTREQKARQEAPRVYYMRIGNRVKIGYSTNLLERVKTINPEELMAVERGHQDVERRRHTKSSGSSAFTANGSDSTSLSRATSPGSYRTAGPRSRRSCAAAVDLASQNGGGLPNRIPSS